MRLEINNRSKSGKLTNMWQLNYTVNVCVTEEIRREIRKYHVMSENKSSTNQNLFNAVKAMLRGYL